MTLTSSAGRSQPRNSRPFGGWGHGTKSVLRGKFRMRCKYDVHANMVSTSQSGTLPKSNAREGHRRLLHKNPPIRLNIVPFPTPWWMALESSGAWQGEQDKWKMLIGGLIRSGESLGFDLQESRVGTLQCLDFFLVLAELSDSRMLVPDGKWQFELQVTVKWNESRYSLHAL